MGKTALSQLLKTDGKSEAKGSVQCMPVSNISMSFTNVCEFSFTILCEVGNDYSLSLTTPCLQKEESEAQGDYVDLLGSYRKSAAKLTMNLIPWFSHGTATLSLPRKAGHDILVQPPPLQSVNILEKKYIYTVASGFTSLSCLSDF